MITDVLYYSHREHLILILEATEMKRYFVDGKEITKQEAELIEKKNNEYFNSGNMEDMLNIKFIVVI